MEELFECFICTEIVNEAVHCSQCWKFLCAAHLGQLTMCPFCKMTPFHTEIDVSIRRLVDQTNIECKYCKERITRGDRIIHMTHCQKKPRRCGIAGCYFETGNQKEGFNHFYETHGQILWEEFTKLTAACNYALLTIIVTYHCFNLFDYFYACSLIIIV